MSLRIVAARPGLQRFPTDRHRRAGVRVADASSPKRKKQLEDGGCAFKDPKTKKSRRYIALHSDALEALRKHKAQQNAVRLALGGKYNTEGLVFPDPITGEAWVPDRFSSAFYYQARKAEINVSFHGLRHSFATIAQRAGASLKDTSDSLGHSAIGITADIYSHVFDDSRCEVAKKVGDALSAARKLG